MPKKNEEALNEEAKMPEQPKPQGEAQTEANEQPKPKGKIAAREPSMEDYVEIMVPRSEKNPGPVFIGVNGENVLVKRGEYVKVKRKFAEALKLSFQQDNAAADYQDMLVREYKEAKM